MIPHPPNGVEQLRGSRSLSRAAGRIGFAIIQYKLHIAHCAPCSWGEKVAEAAWPRITKSIKVLTVAVGMAKGEQPCSARPPGRRPCESAVARAGGDMTTDSRRGILWWGGEGLDAHQMCRLQAV